MKTKFKYLAAALLGIATALFTAAPVAAQQFEIRTITSGTTNLNGANVSSNTIAAASAVGYLGSSIPLAKYDGTSIQLNAKLMGAGTSAITAMFEASADGTNWVSPYAFITVNANGTTAVTTGTNIVNQHWHSLRLNYVTNASNATLTNLQVIYTLKPRRNG